MKNKNITLQIGVKILLKNKAGKYLLLRRSLDKYPDMKDRWDIVGGRINPGEPSMAGLRREVKEEVSLEIFGTPKLLAAQDIILPEKNKHVVRLTYIGEAAEGKIILDTLENDRYEWLTLEELKNTEGLDKYLKELIGDLF